MKEEEFYQQFEKKAMNMRIAPSHTTWSRLDSRLRKYHRRQKIRMWSIWSSAAAVILLLGTYVIFQIAEDSTLVVEGTLEPHNDKVAFINQRPNLPAYSLPEFESDMVNTIQPVKNITHHVRNTHLMEKTILNAQKSNKDIARYKHQAPRIAGEWKSLRPSSDFPDVLQIEQMSTVRIDVTMNDSARSFLLLPGQERYYVLQSDEESISIIERLNETQITLKTVQANSDEFSSVTYTRSLAH